MDTFTLKSSQFRKEREQSWRELEGILERIRRKGLLGLPAADLHRLPSLYRNAASSLSVARAISLDKALLDYLEGLVSRAYLLVYSSKKPLRQVVVEFVASRLPGEVFRYWRFFAAAAALLVLGTLCGLVLTLNDPGRFYSFVPETMAGGRTPESTTPYLRQTLYDTPEENGLTLFASFLFTNNAQVGILCFCLGFAAGVPTAVLLFYNGTIMGAMIALYVSRGLGSDFLAWLAGHGVTELAAVCLCGGAGLVVGWALMFPGEYSRARNLALHGRRIALVVVGAVLMLVVAALLEGYFRQLVPIESARWAVAGITLIFWSWYFLVQGSRQHAPPMT